MIKKKEMQKKLKRMVKKYVFRNVVVYI